MKIINLIVSVLFISCYFLLDCYGSLSYAVISSEIFNNLNEITKKQCGAVKLLQMPVTDLPNKKESLALIPCNSDEYYYGLYSKPDYQKARYCAWVMKDNDVLAMLYANGYGVKKNINLAKHFVCLLDGSAGEIEDMIDGLGQIKIAAPMKRSFEVCNYALSHLNVLRCSALEKEKKITQQKALINQLTSKFTIQERMLVKKIENAFIVYINNRISNELDRTGRDAAVNYMNEELRLQVDYLKYLKMTSTCEVKEYGEKDYLILDNQLNVLYKQIMKGPDGNLSYRVSGVKKTEKAWVHYKLLYERLGILKCPLINKVTWGSVVTKQRIAQLKDIRDEQKLIEEDQAPLG